MWHKKNQISFQSTLTLTFRFPFSRRISNETFFAFVSFHIRLERKKKGERIDCHSNFLSPHAPNPFQNVTWKRIFFLVVFFSVVSVLKTNGTQRKEWKELQIVCQFLNNCWRLPDAPTLQTHTGHKVLIHQEIFHKSIFHENKQHNHSHLNYNFFSFSSLEISNAPLNTLKAFQFPVVAFIILSVFQLSLSLARKQWIVVVLKLWLLFLEGVWAATRQTTPVPRDEK